MWPWSRKKPANPDPDAMAAAGDLAGLTRALGDADLIVRQRARAAMVRLRAQDALISVLREDRRGEAREMALLALQELAPPQLEAALSAALEDADSHIRGLAADMGARPARAEPDALGSPEAVSALRNLGAAGLPAALALLGRPDAAVRRAAADVVVTLACAAKPPPPPALADAILALERDPDPGVRATAAGGMSALGKPGAAALRRLLSDRDPLPRQAAALALSAAGGTASVPELRAALGRGEWAAARALGQLRARDAVPDLIAALRDPRVGAVAAEALAEIGDRRAIPAIYAYIAEAPPPSGPDGDPDPAEIARAALRRLGR